MAKYKPGDKVWVKQTSHYLLVPFGTYKGIVVGICSKPEVAAYLRKTFNCEAYDVDLEGVSGTPSASEIVITPRHDPYEGDQAGSWNTCPFKPEKVFTENTL